MKILKIDNVKDDYFDAYNVLYNTSSGQSDGTIDALIMMNSIASVAENPRNLSLIP